MDAFANAVSLNQMWVCSLMHRDSPTLMLIVSVGLGVGHRRSHLNQLFAKLLEVILRINRSNFNHRHLLLHFLEGNVIIYHVIAYDPKSEKNVRKLYFGCHSNQFLQFKVIFRKDPKTVWQFFIDSDNKKRTSFN